MISPRRTATLFAVYSVLCVAFLALSTDTVVRSLKAAFYYLWSPGNAVVDQMDRWGRFAGGVGALLKADQKARYWQGRWERDRLDDARLKSLEEENQRLNQWLRLEPSPRFLSVTARVVGRDPADWTHALLVRLPPGSQVREGDAVIAMNREVAVALGQVRDVLPGQRARVLVLTDSFSAISGQVTRTGEQGLIEGRPGGGLMLNYLFADSTVRPGDEVVTAGLGDVFPAYILVGTVREVLEPSGSVSKRAWVEPAAPLDRVRDVRVLTRLPEASSAEARP